MFKYTLVRGPVYPESNHMEVYVDRIVAYLKGCVPLEGIGVSMNGDQIEIESPIDLVRGTKTAFSLEGKNNLFEHLYPTLELKD